MVKQDRQAFRGNAPRFHTPREYFQCRQIATILDDNNSTLKIYTAMMIHFELSLGWLLALNDLVSGWEHVTGVELESSVKKHDVLVAACKSKGPVRLHICLRFLADMKCAVVCSSHFCKLN